MPENNPTLAEIQAYRRHHRDEDYWTPPPAAPAAAQAPAQVLEMKSYRGRFQKGFDPRRHQFTEEEIQRGYANALESIAERYPEARCKHDAHISHCFLSKKYPERYRQIVAGRRERRAA